MTGPIAPRLFVTPLTVAAGSTGSISPVLDDVKLQSVRIVIPPGHAGLTALQITQGGAVIFPFGADPFIRGDNEVIDYPWDDEITANGLQVTGVNNDIYPHTWILRWLLTDLANASPVTIASPNAGTPVSGDTAAAVGQLAGVTDASAGLSADDLAAVAGGQLAAAGG